MPNLSVLDGWWNEGWVEGVTGWSIGDRWHEPSEREAEADDIHHKLERDILPLYHAEDDRFDEIRRHAIALNGPQLRARRMMLQYVDRAYRGDEETGRGRERKVPEREAAGIGGE